MDQNVITIRNLTRRFGDRVAVDRVDLDVPRGTVFGLVGENGAGKTTIIKHILGLLDAKSGTVSVFGNSPVRDLVAVLGRIGYLSEDRDLPDWMRLHELERYMQAFFPNWDEQFADDLRQMFELDANAKIGTLSRGQRALAGLLIALAHRPDLLVLDEPSSGLDPLVRRNILAAIIRTVSDEGRTVFFSSHLLDEVERVADHVAMIHEGRIVLCDTMDEIIALHRRLTFRFPEPLPAPPRLNGVTGWLGAGKEWSCLYQGHAEQLKGEAASLGAEILEDQSASLDDIFVARIKG